ncbi:hypothetical protein [Microvirga terricola]|uniref:Uncharacterized protein n=1 Tax=Microvirga terricola TaxID=2719797 RepID=A0ABX0V9V7_9HYPH|nr:hypothetical protein [Microvirga terricola]NIX76338.1 hypothetical protein [Microvirga terricola]
MQRRKIWAGLSSAVLVATPAVSQAAALPAHPHAVEAKADHGLLQLAQAQHKGHAAQPAKAKPADDGEGEGGGGTTLSPSLHFYRGLELIRGHLLVGGELIESGRWAESLPHFLHPEEEIYNSLREDLKSLNIAPFQVALKALSQTVKAKNKEAYVRARVALVERLDAAEKLVQEKEKDKVHFVLEAALETLQQSTDEYGEAFKKGRIANVVEYQDARGFVFEADRLIGTITEALNAKNAEAVKALRASLDDLKATFPTVMPPEKVVKDHGQFLSSVAKFELQLGNFR